MIALFVSFWIRPDTRDRFVAALEEQARTSLAEESGCVRFDVCVDVDDPNHFLLYEIYADEEAFTSHRQTSHFARWSEVKAACVELQESTKARIT